MKNNLKKLLKKDTKWICGEIYIRKESVADTAAVISLINDILGNDLAGLMEMLNAAEMEINELAFKVPVITTEKIWKKLKKSSKAIIATTEHRAEKPEVKGIVLV